MSKWRCAPRVSDTDVHNMRFKVICHIVHSNTYRNCSINACTCATGIGDDDDDDGGGGGGECDDNIHPKAYEQWAAMRNSALLLLLL